MVKISEITRLRAFSVHLAISFVIFLVLLNIILFVWYPSFLFHTDGGWRGIGIIAGVDIVLGPMLTLIVFKPGKPGLKFDLTVIAIIQFSSLCLGTWVVYNQRPALLVFAEDTFMTIPQEQVEQAGLSDDQYKAFRRNRFGTVIVELPQTEPERNKAIQEGYARGGLALRGDKYIPYVDNYRQILNYGIPYDKLVKDDANKAGAVKTFLDSNGLTQQDVAFYPIFIRYGQKIVLGVNRNSGELIDVIDISPPAIDTKIKRK